LNSTRPSLNNFNVVPTLSETESENAEYSQDDMREGAVMLDEERKAVQSNEQVQDGQEAKEDLEEEDEKEDLDEEEEEEEDGESKESESSGEIIGEVDRDLLDAHDMAVAELDDIHKEMAKIKECIYQQRMIEANKEIEAIEQGKHPLLAEKLAEIEQQREFKHSVALTTRLFDQQY